MKTLDYYEKAVQICLDLQKDLGVEDYQCRSFITQVDGKRKQGWRVTVTRLVDGASQSRFIGEET